MATITKSLTIESQGTYNLTFDLWSYSEWAASAGITTSYASLAALIADEKAVRQLMTVHASVDYFATCPDSTIISTVINNNLCAKWINLSDYAFDKLSAKSNIKSVMDTADKYGYGEWGITDSTTTPPTWGPLGNVPIMTADNAPYGQLSTTGSWDKSGVTSNILWYAFDGNDNTWITNPSAQTAGTKHVLTYKFVNPVCVKRILSYMYVTAGGGYSASNFKFMCYGSNDGSTWTAIHEDTVSSNPTEKRYIECTENDDYYLYIKINAVLDSNTWSFRLITLQFYGRELTPLVPTMTANDKPKGQASASSVFSATYPAFQAFDGNINEFWASSENTNDQWVEYDFVDTVKPYQYYIKPFITISGSTAYSKTARVAVQGYVNNAWVNISGKTLVSNSTTTATNTTPSEIRGNITNPAEINKIRINFGEKVGVQRDIIGIFQVYGMDYSEKEFAQGSTRKTFYDHGVELVTVQSKTIGSGAVATKEANQLYISTPTTANTLSVIGGKAEFGGYNYLYAKAGNKFLPFANLGYFTNLPTSVAAAEGFASFSDANGKVNNLTPSLDISSVSGEKYAVLYTGHSSTASSVYAGSVKELWLE